MSFKYMPGRKTNQHFSLICQKMLDNPREFFKQFTTRQRAVLNKIFYFDSTTGRVYMRQDTLGKWCGFSREHVNRFLAKLKELGIISWMGRYMQSCVYYVNPIFRDCFFRSKLKHLFSALAYFHIGLLEPNVTLIDSFIYKTATSSKQQEACLPKGIHEVIYARTRAHKADTNKINHEAGDDVLVKPYVESIQNPVLTYEEKLLLSNYSEAAVRSALIALQRKRDVTNPVGFMLYCCKDFTKGNTKGSSKYAAPTGGAAEKESAVRAPHYDQYQPKEVRDADFWKKDNDRYAHWDMVVYGPQLDNLKRLGLNSLNEIFLEKLRVAHAQHNEATCSFCITHGPRYKVVPTLTERQLTDNQEWEKSKYEANEQNIRLRINATPRQEGVLNYKPYPLGTVAPRYVPSMDAAAHAAPEDAPPPTPSPERQMATIMAGLLPGLTASSPKGYAETRQGNEEQPIFELEENNWPVEYCGEPEDEILSLI